MGNLVKIQPGEHGLIGIGVQPPLFGGRTALPHEIFQCAGKAELGGFVVSEGLRGLSIGRLLMAAAQTWARSQGVEKLRVRTRSSRLEAHLFYEGLGFAQTKQQLVYDLDLLASV